MPFSVLSSPSPAHEGRPWAAWFCRDRSANVAAPDSVTLIRVRLAISSHQPCAHWYPNLPGRLCFNAFLVPSRTHLEVYRAYREAVFDRLQRLRARVEAWTAQDWLAARLRDLGSPYMEPLQPALAASGHLARRQL